MSQSRDKEGDEHPDQFRANNALAVMLDHGMSISGNERHCVFLNTGADERAGERFACVSAVSGLDVPDDGRGVSVVDWDGDGDQDLWISNRNAPRIRYFRNDTITKNNFIELRLVGNGSTTSRDAVGARVEVILDSGKEKTGESQKERLVKTVHIGQGFLSQSSRWLHFGIGDHHQIEKITVRWPGGDQEDFANLKINQRYELHQDGTVREVPPPPATAPLPAASPELPEAADRFRVPLVAVVPMPNLPYTNASGQSEFLLESKPDDGMLLINCWSTTCVPCLKELKEFTDRAEELRKANINVLALCLDTTTDASSDTRPEDILRKMGYPFAYGKAPVGVGGALSTIHNVMTATGGLLPVPTSFLVDKSGQLVAIYKGPVSVETLIADKDHSSLPPWERFRRAANLPGTIVENAVLEKALTKGDHSARTRLANHLEEQGWSHAASIQYEALAKKMPDSPEKKVALSNVFFERGLLLARQKQWAPAVDAFRESLKNKSSFATAHYNLGICLQKLGKIEEARHEYEEAIRLDPKLISARANLGRLLAQEKDWAQAEIQFQKVVGSRPNDTTSIYNLGVSLERQQKLEEAATQFKRVLELKPDFAPAQKYLQRIEAKTSSKDPAKD